MNLTNCFHFVMINHLSYFQNLTLNWKTPSTNFRKAPSYHFNCFISQAPVLVKTLDLAGFMLRLGRDTSADHRPGNRNFQDGQQFPTFLPGWTHLGMGTKSCP